MKFNKMGVHRSLKIGEIQNSADVGLNNHSCASLGRSNTIRMGIKHSLFDKNNIERSSSTSNNLKSSSSPSDKGSNDLRSKGSPSEKSSIPLERVSELHESKSIGIRSEVSNEFFNFAN